MADSSKKGPVRARFVSPGFEAVFAEAGAAPKVTDPITVRTPGEAGNVINRWPVFAWTFSGQEKHWDDEIRQLNNLQAELGPLDDDTRQIRAHIGSLVPCDSGLPVTIDELLAAIGRGKLDEPSFRNGCWCPGMWWQLRTTQPRHMQSMRTIHAVLKGYWQGRTRGDAVADCPHAVGLIERAYKWLGPRSELNEVQSLMFERMLLTIECFTRYSGTDPSEPDAQAALEVAIEAGKDLFEDGGRGSDLDARIAAKAGLPKIVLNSPELFAKNLDSIDDPAKRELYEICCRVASGVCTLSDCHHNTFRYIEGWIHGIGTGHRDIATRRAGAERERLGRLLFGYAMSLDKWLLGVPSQFLLLDLGHVELGFDPANEVLRVYAYLGERRTPAKQWLAACLWHSLVYSRIAPTYPAGLIRHEGLSAKAHALGLSTREWMDSELLER